MVFHSSLTAAAAAAHRHDLMVDAERYRTARTVRAAFRRALRAADPPPPVVVEKQDEECRYAMSR